MVITVHKLQELILQCAITDAGSRCFGPSMICVILSRMASSIGLRLVEFDPTKIILDLEALLQYNRLRKIYRSDLPLFEIPVICLRNFPVEASLPTECECHSKNYIGKCPSRKTTKFEEKKTSDISTNIHKTNQPQGLSRLQILFLERKDKDSKQIYE